MSIESVVDIDGNEYSTVRIGGQIWMAENLRVTHYRNGEGIYHVTDPWESRFMQLGGYFSHQKDLARWVHYNWYAVSDARNLAPVGWHVATDKEWKVLERHIGGSRIAGEKLRVIDLEHWVDPEKQAHSQFGFNAEPFGFQGTSYRSCLMVGDWAGFWTASSSFGKPLDRTFNKESTKLHRNRGNPNIGCSVRCVKD
jgi:uncharacterized protein (TIGR02145 family)